MREAGFSGDQSRIAELLSPNSGRGMLLFLAQLAQASRVVAFSRAQSPRSQVAVPVGRRTTRCCSSSGADEEWSLPVGWRRELRDYTESEECAQLRAFVEEERSTQTVFPDRADVFNALRLTDFDNVKVCIIGQDPYHGAGQAHGLAFSVRQGTPAPPSLKNIAKELKRDVGLQEDLGDLTEWASQGVLLLNTVLTVREGEPNSHAGRGWEHLTDAVVNALLRRKSGVVFLLWGKRAQDKLKKEAGVTSSIFLTAAHPSPLSASRGFHGCGHFSEANALLKARYGETGIAAWEPKPAPASTTKAASSVLPEQLSALRRARASKDAPVDSVGCTMLGDKTQPPEIFRFQTLFALMISPRTRDANTAAAVRALQQRGLLTASSIVDMPSSLLLDILAKYDVTWAGKKVKYTKDAARICLNEHGGDVPRDFSAISVLPGVGQKVAHLLSQTAWGEVNGIAVDTHVHRIANRLGWVNTTTALKTQKALELLLPREEWQPINPLLVGLGQQRCTAEEPKCGGCDLLQLCPRVGLTPLPPSIELPSFSIRLDQGHRDYTSLLKACAPVVTARSTFPLRVYDLHRSKFATADPDELLANLRVHKWDDVTAIVENLKRKGIWTFARSRQQAPREQQQRFELNNN